tara:strand:- start:598 stop:930 length:333 start_codon:yes stop_codon:yes gene_type:complete
MSLIEISYTNYLDSINKNYKKILIVNMLPDDPIFKSIIKQINTPRLSPFTPHNGTNCIYGITDPRNQKTLLELDNIGILFNFLVSNNFQLHNAFNDVIKQNSKFICYVSK